LIKTFASCAELYQKGLFAERQSSDEGRVSGSIATWRPLVTCPVHGAITVACY